MQYTSVHTVYNFQDECKQFQSVALTPVGLCFLKDHSFFVDISFYLCAIGVNGMLWFPVPPALYTSYDMNGLLQPTLAWLFLIKSTIWCDVTCSRFIHYIMFHWICRLQPRLCSFHSTDLFLCTSPIKNYNHCPSDKVSSLLINNLLCSLGKLWVSLIRSLQLYLSVCFPSVCLGRKAFWSWLSGAGYPD